MADLTLVPGQSIPSDTNFRYRDMGDGTHALEVFIKTTPSAGSDIVLSTGQSIPATMQTRYADMGGGVYAIVKAA